MWMAGRPSRADSLIFSHHSSCASMSVSVGGLGTQCVFNRTYRGYEAIIEDEPVGAFG
jgi:hypothetical protein